MDADNELFIDIAVVVMALNIILATLAEVIVIACPIVGLNITLARQDVVMVMLWMIELGMIMDGMWMSLMFIAWLIECVKQFVTVHTELIPIDCAIDVTEVVIVVQTELS